MGEKTSITYVHLRGINMSECMKIYIDESKAIIILSYETGIYDDVALINVRENLKKAYGYEVIMIPNATITIV